MAHARLPVIFHCGELHGRGHYVCAINTPKGWLEVSDSQLIPVAKEDVFKARSVAEGQAYMLCYQRVGPQPSIDE
jgi:ubiquitin C-terminal hydrolase